MNFKKVFLGLNLTFLITICALCDLSYGAIAAPDISTNDALGIINAIRVDGPSRRDLRDHILQCRHIPDIDHLSPDLVPRAGPPKSYFKTSDTRVIDGWFSTLLAEVSGFLTNVTGGGVNDPNVNSNGATPGGWNVRIEQERHVNAAGVLGAYKDALVVSLLSFPFLFLTMDQ